MAPYLSKELSGELHGKHKEEIARAIEHYLVTGQVEKLVQVCNACLYTIFDAKLLVSECSACRVYHLKKKIAKIHAAENRDGENALFEEGLEN